MEGIKCIFVFSFLESELCAFLWLPFNYSINHTSLAKCAVSLSFMMRISSDLIHFDLTHVSTDIIRGKCFDSINISSFSDDTHHRFDLYMRSA
jgi:hypothetical protein